MPSTKTKTSNGHPKTTPSKTVAESRKHLEEREICKEATALVNGYIKNMNKEFDRGRALYLREKKRLGERQKGLIGCVQRRVAKKWFDGKTDDPAFKAFIRSIKTDYEAWKKNQPPEASEEQWKPFDFKVRLNRQAKPGDKRKAADYDQVSTDFTDETEQYDDDDVFDRGTRKEPESDADSDDESDVEDAETAHEERAEESDDNETEEPASSSGDPMRGYLAQPVRRDNPKGKRSRFDKPVKGQQGATLQFNFS